MYNNKSDCTLLMMDSSMSAGWPCKTNFREIIGEGADPVQAKARIKSAQHHATLFLKAGITKYSQWFLGQENNVADVLLCDFDCSDNELTQILRETCPSQLLLHFQIAPLPNKINSWLTALCIPAETSCKGAVTGSTHKNHAQLWHRFTKYLGTIGISNDIFLDSFTRSQ